MERIAVYAGIVIILIFVLASVKQGTFWLGLTGSSGDLMPYLHHSRWGAFIAIAGIFTVFESKKETIKELGILMIVIGLVLVFQHLATEQCFAVGGFC